VSFDDPDEWIRVKAGKLVIGGDGKAPRILVGVRLKIPITAEAFSVNYAFDIARYSAIDPICVEFEPGAKWEFIFTDEKNSTQAKAGTNRRRIECIRAKDQATGAEFAYVNWFENGQLRTRNLVRGRVLSVRISQTPEGEQQYSSFEIRELVPQGITASDGQ
jgi:hypothetical protein